MISLKKALRLVLIPRQVEWQSWASSQAVRLQSPFSGHRACGPVACTSEETVGIKGGDS